MKEKLEDYFIPILFAAFIVVLFLSVFYGLTFASNNELNYFLWTKEDKIFIDKAFRFFGFLFGVFIIIRSIVFVFELRGYES